MRQATISKGDTVTRQGFEILGERDLSKEIARGRENERKKWRSQGILAEGRGPGEKALPRSDASVLAVLGTK